MNSDKWNTLALFFFALCLLIAACSQPLFTVSFDPPISSEILAAKNLIYSTKKTGSIFFGNALSDNILSQFFGPELFSNKCEPIWESCFQDWLAQKADIQVGPVYLFQTMLKMLKEQLLLGLMTALMLFLLPLLKCILGLYLLLQQLSKQQTFQIYQWLDFSGKWAWIDPLIIVMSIVMYNTEKNHLSIIPQMGIFLIALCGIASTIGVYFLGQQYGKKTIYTNLDIHN